MKKGKRLLAIILALVMTLSLVACTGSTPDSSTASTPESSTPAEGEESSAAAAGEAKFPIVDEPIKLSFYVEVWDLKDMDKYLSNMKDNKLLAYIKEKTNIELELIPLSAAPESKQKVVLALAGGEYPDGGMFSWNTQLSRADIVQYGVNEGLVQPLTKQIDQYGIEIKKIFESRPTLRAQLTAPDGEIYGIPRFSECYHCTSYPKLWLNYDWLEKLGLKEPQTTDELYTVLKAFKEQDPNGNGKADEIGLTGTIDYSSAVEYWLMNSFLDCPAVGNANDPRPFLHWNETTESVDFFATKPEYKEGLEWIKKLYDEGLIDPANFTQNSDGLKQQVRTEVATAGGVCADHYDMGMEYANWEMTKQYKALPPVAGPKGVRYQSYNALENQITGFSFVLFDKCENVDAAVQLADWLLTPENSIILGFGGLEEGGGWTKNTDESIKDIIGNPLYGTLNPLPADATQEQKDERGSWNAPLMPYGDTFEVRASINPPITEETLKSNYETYLWEGTDRVKPYWPKVSLPHDVFMDSATSDEFTELKLNLNAHVQKNTSMFITGARSLDEWDKYVQEIQQLNVDRYVEIYNEAYKTISEAQ